MTIGLTGPFCDNNFGDYAMLINNIYDMSAINPDIEKFIVFCYDRGLIEILKDDYLSQYNVEIVELESTEKIELPQHYFGLDYTDKLLTPLEIIQTISNLSYVKAKVREVDVMVENGGGHFDYYWLGVKRRYKLYDIVAPLIIARQLNKKVVTLGCSYGPWGRNQDFFFGLFNYIDFDVIDCRDNLYSKKYLNQLSVFDNIFEVCDDLIAFNCKLEKKAKQFNDNRYFIIDLYASIQDIEHNIQSIIDFVNRTKTEQGLTPVFVAHGSDYNGTRQAELIKKYIPELVIYNSGKEYLPIEDFLSVLKGAQFVLCEHYHSFVLSMTHKIPAVMFMRKIDGNSYYYFNKTVGFIKNSHILDNTEHDESLLCVTSLPELFDSSDTYNSRLTEIRKILKDATFENKKLDYMKQLLQASGG